MTVVDHPARTADVHVVGTARLLAGVGAGRLDHSGHVMTHSAPALHGRRWLSDALHGVNLLGRGGAGFPVGAKLDAMPGGSGCAVLVNGSESEPASRKDRTLMTLAPHLVLDGALVVAHALGTTRITIAVHDAASAASLEQACRERDDTRSVDVVRTHDGFVGGEVRAVVNGVNGSPAVPGGRRVLPHVHGMAALPTFASNVETFAQVALLSRLGAHGYAQVGSGGEPGTSLVTLLGHVAVPGVVEVPNGTPLSVLLPGPPSPTLIGGYHGTWVADPTNLVVDRISLSAAGSPLGAGVIARPYVGTCVLDEVARVAAWLASESAGQCGPCFFGLPALADDLAAIVAGAGPERLDQLRRRSALVRGRGACAHPDGSVQLVSSAMTALTDELDAHARFGTCGHTPSAILPLGGAA